MSRGLRNNNPLNIRHGKSPWRGLAEDQPDKAFCKFVAPEWGYRAALITLRSYQSKHGLRTVRQMIGRWAPPNENNTEAYISSVCRRASLEADTPVNLQDRDTAVRLMAAMSYVENGKVANLKDVAAGYDLA
ncbi:MAG: structural protein P5 [Porphyromonadaceae bacterium]|nr:structural protein P5 [Porphyromonadaceae bacterium]